MASSIVHNILNMVDLNTSKYNKKLQKMKRDTKSQTKDIGSSFSSMASAWKAALVGIASASLVNAVRKELESTEKAVAGFISSFGGVDQARVQFEMLQQAARDTIQPFDALKNVTMNLKRNGIQPAADTLKSFSQIAYGTGQSLETVGSAFTSAIQGRYKALNQLGIMAQDQGSKLALTYKGVTTTIDKSAESLHDYFVTVGKENEGVLDYLQSGMTGAVNYLDNAWGDLVRAIGESGLGDLITQIMRDVASAMDGLTSWISQNGPYIKGFFDGLIEGWKAVYETTRDVLSSALDVISDFFNDSEDEALTGLNNIGLFLSRFFDFARIGFLENVAKPAAVAWGSIKGGFKGAGEALGTFISTGSIDKAVKNYDNVLNQAADNTIETMSVIGNAIKLQFDDIDRKVRETRNNLKKELPTAPTVPTFNTSFGGKGTGGAGKSQSDNWQKYYDKVKDIAKSSLSDVQKLHLEHEQKIAELEKEYSQSRLATESEYLDARKILDDDYFRQYQELEKQAQQFIAEINGDELLQLQDSYREKLEMLEQYHADSLISEEDYLKTRNKLYDDYTTEMNKIDKSKRQGMLSDVDIENLNSFHDAMDSMSDAFSNLTQGLSETSASYKALFTIQKSFAVASATVKAALAWMTALSGASTWYEAVANYATAISMTTGVIAQLRSVSMHDKGGYIGAGKLGIVGEYGPELVQGPATVTSRKETAAMARASLSGSSVTVNLYESRDKAGTVEQDSRDGEQIINIFVSNIRKGGQIAQTMESTYQLKRLGA